MLNLEPIAVKAAATMVTMPAKEAENMNNKALMVLAEQGVCAFALFLASRKRHPQDTVPRDAIHAAMKELLRAAKLGNLNSSIDVDDYKQLTYVQAGETELAALQRLLLTKQLMETALTYGRYQAKANSTGD